MGEETAAPPSSSHILRPHHVGLLTIFILILGNAKAPEASRLVLPPQFLLHVYRLLLSEAAEVVEPRTCQELLAELRAAPMATAPGSAEFVRSIESVVCSSSYADEEIVGPTFSPEHGHSNSRSIVCFLYQLVANSSCTICFLTSLIGTPAMFMDRGEDEELPILARRSLFGFFCRRCFTSFLKLSFSGLSKLQKDYQAWVRGEQGAGYDVVRRDQLNSIDHFISKTRVDKKEWATTDSLKSFERGWAAGDHKVAVESVRHFFEQRFNEGTDSGLRQHALLNLVRMHYVNTEYESARKLLNEAVSVARTKGDRVALQHCISMLHRMPESPESIRLPINDIQPDLHPLEVLYDVKKLLDDTYEQPLATCFKRVAESIGIFDLWNETKPNGLPEAEQWAQHAIQSIIWNASGCGRLASVEEDIVISFTDTGSTDNNRIICILNKAYDLARNGHYDTALCILLEPDTWRGLMLSDYDSWASTVWHVLVLRASRRGQQRVYREQLVPRRGPGAWNMRYYFNDRAVMTYKQPQKLHDPLYEVLQMKQTPGAPSALEPLLAALWYSEFMGRLETYRTAVIMLADYGLEYGMSKRSKRIISEIMPQVINGDNVEQRALACFTLARSCILADGMQGTLIPDLKHFPSVFISNSEDGLQEAARYLVRAESDYKQLEMYKQAQDVQYCLAIVYHNLGQESDRDKAAIRHAELEKKQKEMDALAFDLQMQEVLDLVATIGGALTDRR